MPLLAEMPGNCGSALVEGRAFAVAWRLANGSFYHLFANLVDKDWAVGPYLRANDVASADDVYSNHKRAPDELNAGTVSAYTALFVHSPVRLFDQPNGPSATWIGAEVQSGTRSTVPLPSNFEAAEALESQFP